MVHGGHAQPIVGQRQVDVAGDALVIGAAIADIAAGGPGLRVLLTRLIEPPPLPPPFITPSEPLVTSIESTANTSRLCALMSRTPSRYIELELSVPRMKGRSPSGLPPSPAPSAMPGTVRSASASEAELVSSSTWREITVMVRGVSTSGAVALGLSSRSVL
jgi:hypothetical protein